MGCVVSAVAELYKLSTWLLVTGHGQHLLDTLKTFISFYEMSLLPNRGYVKKDKNNKKKRTTPVHSFVIPILILI